jgi:hypothetical protein
MTKLVRMEVSTYEKLLQLSKETGISKQRLMDIVLERYKRDQIMDMANRAYEDLKKDSKGWQEELEERELWDSTLADGLKND